MFDTALEELVQRSLLAGGFADLSGLGFRPDATAWAALALAAAERRRDLVERAGVSLAAVQLDDGRITISPEHPEAFWPTPLAVLAWGGMLRQRQARERATTFLLNTTGNHWPKEPASPVGHDTTIPGWPWTAGAHSWVEPTAMALLALRAAGFEGHHRVQEGIRLLLDRQLSGGGWNHGNTRVFERELYPLVEYTGIALEALEGMVPREEIAKSIDYLAREIRQVRTPLSLGWGLLGLGAWGERPQQGRAWVAEALSRQGGHAQCRTSHLALLLVASEAKGGLADTLEEGGGEHNA